MGKVMVPVPSAFPATQTHRPQSDKAAQADPRVDLKYLRIRHENSLEFK